MRSMTGYGRGESELNGRRVVIEMKSVNHRFLDLNVKLPKVLSAYEEFIRSYIKGRIARGHLDVYVNYDSVSEEDFSLELNTALADKYLTLAEETAKRYGLTNDISVETLFSIKDVLKYTENQVCEEEIKSLLTIALEIACDKLSAMRDSEGARIKTDLIDKANNVESTVNAIKAAAPLQVERYRNELRERITEGLQGIELDENKLINEVVFYADKVATDEEFTRLLAHVEHFREIAEKNEPIGRQLDFIVQEMNREANTIGSKCSDIELANCVLSLKTDIEKIREQIQNIE